MTRSPTASSSEGPRRSWRALALSGMAVLTLAALAIRIALDATLRVEATFVPQFIPGPARPPAGSHLSYSAHGTGGWSGTRNPIHHDRLWVSTWIGHRTNFASYLFDLEAEKVLGYVRHAEPLALTPDGSKVLCATQVPAEDTRLRQVVARWIAKLSRGRISLPALANMDREQYWLVALHNGRARLVGEWLEPRWGGTSGGRPVVTGSESPDGRRWLVLTLTRELGVIELAEGRLTKFSDTNFYDYVWLDNDRLVYKTRSEDLEVLDLKDSSRSLFATRSQIAAFLSDHELLPDPRISLLFPTTDGLSYAVFLAPETIYESVHLPGAMNDNDTWILQLGAATPRLRLKSLRFKFRLGHELNSPSFNLDGTSCLFSGKAPGSASGDGAVYLADLQTATGTVLVAADRLRRAPSHPIFYRNRVLYLQEDALWSVNADGTNRRRLFP